MNLTKKLEEFTDCLDPHINAGCKFLEALKLKGRCEALLEFCIMLLLVMVFALPLAALGAITSRLQAKSRPTPNE